MAPWRSDRGGGRWRVEQNVSYYHDHDHTFDVSTSTLLAQLHVYV